MKIYVVNMARSTDRKQRISELLSGIGLEFEFFSAIDGRVSEITGYDNERRMKEKGHALTLGERGCFASHRALWKKCVSLQENMLILEDDIGLSDDFLAFFITADSLTSQYEYIRLGRGPLKGEISARSKLLPWLYSFPCGGRKVFTSFRDMVVAGG